MPDEIARLLRGIPAEDHYVAASFIDVVSLYNSPHRYGISLVLHRAYRRAAAQCDHNRWRHVLSSCQE